MSSIAADGTISLWNCATRRNLARFKVTTAGDTDVPLFTVVEGLFSNWIEHCYCT